MQADPSGPAQDAATDTQTVSHGTDIASQRIDELDLEALRFVVSPKIPKRVALDLACGLGTQGIRFAVLGCRTFLYDLTDIGERVDKVRRALDIDSLVFRQLDLRQAISDDFPPGVGVAYSQRFIHYLRFEEASRLIAVLGGRLRTHARLFLSASGLESELGEGYAHAQQPIERRFAPLSAPMQAKHEMREPVCLYTQSELQSLLLPQGFRAVRVWSSPFGNVKGVFEKA